MTSAPSELTIKRKVAIKSLVTNEFKKRMVFDLNQAITGIQASISKMDEILLSDHISSDYKQQLEQKKRRSELSIEELKLKIDTIKKLEVGSLFTQGAVDGFVTIKKGDNLFDKLGSMDVVLKDGIIQEITTKKDAQLVVN